VTEITFDGGSGTLGNVLVGMTLLVGTSAGSRDKGTVRIRKTPGASTFYIGATSEVEWANDLYLTVIDDFELRAKLPQVLSDQIYVDWDVTYVDQHANFAPVPVMGPHAVLKLIDGSVDFEPDGSGSWVLGSTISSYAWAAPGASATADLNTNSPTITYNSPGWKRISCTVTAGNGKSSTGYRRVYVYDDEHLPAEDFELISCHGDVDNGGWQFEIALRDEAEEADVVENALVVLFAEDWYGSTQQSLGYLAGYENVITLGRIDGESIEYDGEKGTVNFKVLGSNELMKHISTDPAYYTNAETPADWDEFSSPTVDKALFDLLYWRSTATMVMDVFLSGDTRRMPEIELSIDKIWSQIEKIAEQRMLARPCCDRYDRLFVEIPAQLVAVANRSSIPVVMAITKDDWGDQIDIDRKFPEVGMVELSGIVDDTPEQRIMSRAPGNAIANFGKVESFDNLVFDNQTHANTLSALYYAWLNNPFPWVDMPLKQNNRMADLCPNQYITLTVAAADTPREIEWTNKKLIIKRITLEYKRGAIYTQFESEAETDLSVRNRSTGVTIEIPIPWMPGEPGIELPGFEEPVWPGLEPGDWGWNPPYVPPGPYLPPSTGDCPTDAPPNGPYSVGISGVLSGITGALVDGKIEIDGTIRCIIRTSAHDHQTKYSVQGTFMKLKEGSATEYEEIMDNDFWTIRAINGAGTVIATGVHDAVTDPKVRTGTFNAISASEITRVKLTLESAELLRPDDIDIFAGGDGTIVEEGVMKWGLYGSGIWVQHLGIVGKKVILPVPSAIIIKSDFTLMKNGEEMGFEYGTKLIGTCQIWTRVSFEYLAQAQAVLDKIYSDHYSSQIGWETLWTVDYEPNLPVPTGLIHSGIQSFEATITPANPTPRFVNLVRGGGSSPDGNFIVIEIPEVLTYMWLPSPYKISVNQVNLYNVCPPGPL
jgi:hypothetical protein